MTRDTVSLGGGTGLVRAWRIDQVRAETHLEIWTPLRGKLLLAGVCAVVALPAPMLWLEIAGFRISDWVLATVYSLAALVSIVAAVRFAGCERVRVRRVRGVVPDPDLRRGPGRPDVVADDDRRRHSLA